MNQTRTWALVLLLVGIFIGYFVYASEVDSVSRLYRPFRLGLDLQGGSHLVYEADVAELASTDIGEAMSSLKDVIDRRINAFGVTEPVIQVEQAGVGDSAIHRLIIELPGVTDLTQATKLIDATPVLEFKTERPEGPEKQAIIAAWTKADALKQAGQPLPNDPLLDQDPYFVPSELTGRYLEKAAVQFNQQSLGPSISLEFTPEGQKIFADITRTNVGKPVAIYLDGQPISTPVVREEIRDGRAEISGQFSVEEAKELVRNLNLGALPVPIKLVSTQTIGATLGEDALNKGVKAGVVGFLVIALFMILWYRLPGLVAAVSLSIYVALVLAIFKLFGVTLTAAGIAGFILSIGIAVDANVLIFERMKEELKSGRHIHEGIIEGFTRAWLSIRDSNLSGIISAIVLFWFGSSLIKGFALTLLIGIIISMFTAITVTRTFLLALGINRKSSVVNFLFGSGVTSSH